MASLSADGKKILNNYDRFTGVPFNATIYPTLPSGKTVDNAIWFKNKPEFGGGFAKRDYEGIVNVKWFGAKGDGVSDDWAAIQLCISSTNNAANPSQHPTIFLPVGVYNISKTLYFDAGARPFMGEHFNTKIVATAAMDSMLSFSTTFQNQRSFFSNFTLDGSSLANYGLYNETMNHSEISRIRVLGTLSACIAIGGWCNDIIGNELAFNLGDGLRLINANNNNVNVLRNKIFGNDGIGLSARAGFKVNIKDNDIELNKKCGIYIQYQIVNLSIDDNYFESNGIVGMTFTNPAITIKTNVILNGSTNPLALSSAFPSVNVSIRGSSVSLPFADSFVFLGCSQGAEIKNNSLFNLPSTGADLISLYLTSTYTSLFNQMVNVENNTGYNNIFRILGYDSTGVYPNLTPFRINELISKKNYLTNSIYDMSLISAGNATSYIRRSSEKYQNQEVIEIGSDGSSTASAWGWSFDLDAVTELAGAMVSFTVFLKVSVAGVYPTVNITRQKALNSLSSRVLDTITPTWVKIVRTFELPTSGTVRISIGKTGADGTVFVANPTLAFIGVDLLNFYNKPEKPIWRSTAAPTIGTWQQSDIVWKTNTVLGSNVGWICVASGTPGTWSQFATINADADKPTAGNTALRPTVTTVGFRYYDTTLGRPLYWNGSAWVNSDPDATTAAKGLVLKAATSANTATVAAGATPTKAEFDALLTEFRDFKTKAQTAGQA